MDPDYKDDDIFDMKPAQLDALKQRLAVIANIKYRMARAGDFSLSVAGSPALAAEDFKTKVQTYIDLLQVAENARDAAWNAKACVSDRSSFIPSCYITKPTSRTDSIFARISIFREDPIAP